MIELSPEIFALIFLLTILAGVLTGYHLALVLGGVGAIIGYLTMGPPAFVLMYMRVEDMLLNYNMLAIPLFTFMGVIFSRSGIADKLYDALHLWLGGLRGGLALSTVMLGTLIAASLGVVQASVGILTIVALGPMLKRGYSKDLACGSICAGGTLGILIPPSIMLVILGISAGLSIGKLFMGAIFPGFLLSALYSAYIVTRSLLQPRIAPPAPIEERRISLAKKTTLLLGSLVPPLALILSVLGSIFFGIATVYEAAGVGAAAAVVLAIAYRKFNGELLKYSMRETLRITGFVMLITSCATAAVGVFVWLGGMDVARDMILAIPFGRWGVFVSVMLATFILGMFIDWIGILFIVVPIVIHIVPALGFDPLWFAMMIVVNLQMSFMTPPLAQAIFVCQGTASPEFGVTMGDIIRGVIPFIMLIILGLGLFVAFPELVLWLPAQMIR